MRVVLADDSMLLREGIARLLSEHDFDIVAQAGDAEDLLRKVNAHKPDVAIIDVRMPPTHTDEGLRAAAEIRERFPGVGVLVLSQYVEERYAMELLQDSAEGIGYLLKDRVADLDRFVEAVRRVGEGGSALDPEVVSRLLGRRRQEDPLGTLSPREREVIELMAEGRSNHAIAEQLVVTERAVEKHVTSIFNKLGLPPTQRTTAASSRCSPTSRRDLGPRAPAGAARAARGAAVRAFRLGAVQRRDGRRRPPPAPGRRGGDGARAPARHRRARAAP